MFEFKADPRPVTLLNSKKQSLDAKSTAPLEKERLYVYKEEQQAKATILSRKMNDFRAKKNTNPYDLKIESKFRIQPNLGFFLNDQKILAGEEKKSIFVQTDQFKKKVNVLPEGGQKKNGESLAFLEKKTGKDEGVQVDLDELFDFEKAVKPIIGVLITKTLEQSLLEVEEEVEIANLVKFKDEYVNRKLAKEQADLTTYIQKEKTKAHNFANKCTTNRHEAGLKRKQEVQDMSKVLIVDVLDVVYRVIDTIEAENQMNKKDKRVVNYEKAGLKLLSDKLDAKIRIRTNYDELFDTFISNPGFLSTRERLCKSEGYQTYLHQLKN